jgi:hypothetical protein
MVKPHFNPTLRSPVTSLLLQASEARDYGKTCLVYKQLCREGGFSDNKFVRIYLFTVSYREPNHTGSTFYSHLFKNSVCGLMAIGHIL